MTVAVTVCLCESDRRGEKDEDFSRRQNNIEWYLEREGKALN